MRLLSSFLPAGLAAALLLSTAPACAGMAAFDSSAEFSATQGAAGWTYGWYAVPGDARSFTALQYRADIDSWTRDGQHPERFGIYTVVGRELMHPAWLAGDLWTVRRWTSGVAGELGITGDFRPNDVGTARLHVIVDGVELWAGAVRPGGALPSLTTTVEVGSTVDFVVDAFDRSEYNDTIWMRVTGDVTSPFAAAAAAAAEAGTVSVPSSLLLSLGGLGLLGLSGRRRMARA